MIIWICAIGFWFGTKKTLRLNLAYASEIEAAHVWLMRPRDSYGEFANGLYRYVMKPFDRVVGAQPKISAGDRDETINGTIDASVFKRWHADRTSWPQNLENWSRRFKIVGSVSAGCDGDGGRKRVNSCLPLV